MHQGNPLPRIDDIHHDSRSLLLRRYRHGPFRGCMAQGIFQKVRKKPPQRVFVARDVQIDHGKVQSGVRMMQIRMRVMPGSLRGLGSLSQNHTQRHTLPVHRIGSGIGAGQQQQVLDQADRTISSKVGGFQGAAVIRRRAAVQQSEAGIGFDDGQRGTQLMGRIRGELPLLLVGGLHGVKSRL